MHSTEDYKALGYLEHRELIELMTASTSTHPDTLRMWLSGPLNKLRGLLIQDGMIVLPDDRSWQCLYAPDLDLFLAAYLAWHRFGERHSVVEVVNFYNDFNDGKMNAYAWVPKRLQKRLQELQAEQPRPGQVGGVKLQLVG